MFSYKLVDIALDYSICHSIWPHITRYELKVMKKHGQEFPYKYCYLFYQ